MRMQQKLSSFITTSKMFCAPKNTRLILPLVTWIKIEDKFRAHQLYFFELRPCSNKKSALISSVSKVISSELVLLSTVFLAGNFEFLIYSDSALKLTHVEENVKMS